MVYDRIDRMEQEANEESAYLSRTISNLDTHVKSLSKSSAARSVRYEKMHQRLDDLANLVHKEREFTTNAMVRFDDKFANTADRDEVRELEDSISSIDDRVRRMQAALVHVPSQEDLDIMRSELDNRLDMIQASLNSRDATDERGAFGGLALNTNDTWDREVDPDETLALQDIIGDPMDETMAVSPPKIDRDQPISFRNNNPGNLRPTPEGGNRWRGEIDTTNGYAMFKEPIFGIRAMCYLLRVSYAGRLGIETIESIVDRYAPHGDNSPAARRGYKNFLVEATGKGPLEILPLEDNRFLFQFVQAIARFEAGKSYPHLTWENFTKAAAMLPERHQGFIARSTV